MSFRNKTGAAVKNLLESQGVDGAERVIVDLLEQKKIGFQDFSIKELWEQCTLFEHGRIVSVQEAITSASFPKITGALINSKIISAYDAVQTIGDSLVTTNPSNVQLEVIAGFTDAETPEEVGEGQEYNDSTLSEKYVTAQNVKYGRMISVTEEMIYFDKTGQIMNRANRIGQKAAQYKEKLIVEGVMDINTTVYRPSGVPTAFYSAGNGNLKTSNTFGETGLEEILKLAHAMKDDSIGTTNNDYVYIDINNADVLVPMDLWVEAWQMAMTTKVPEGNENAENYFKGRFNPMTSPYITQQSASTWFWGNFKEDFWWNEVWPLQTLAQGAGHEDSFKSDVKMRTKTRFYGNIAAVDVKHSFKSTG